MRLPHGCWADRRRGAGGRWFYLYLILDALTLLLLSFAFQQPIAVYLVTALSALFPVLVLIERPYSKFLRDF